MTAVTDNLLCLISFISIQVMILIADSGATKTDWCLGTSDTECRWIQTEGINPFHQSEETIRNIIQSQLLPSLSSVLTQIHSIFFYGAGCTPSLAGIVRQALSTYFPSQTIAVETDLLGAARALCKDQAGIACILGTGSNSCLYDGSQITHNVSPLGYILGDEGSGAYLGKRFIGDCLKKQLPSFICDGLFEELKLTVPELLDKVYRQPQANRFLAGIAPYIHRNKSVPEVQAFLQDCFHAFFQRNVSAYGHSLPVSFTGSVAWFFQDDIKATASQAGFTTGLFIKNPIHDLINYHLKY